MSRRMRFWIKGFIYTYGVLFIGVVLGALLMRHVMLENMGGATAPTSSTSSETRLDGPLRPSCMKLASPTTEEEERYQELDQEFYAQRRTEFGSRAYPIQHEREATRIYAARDRIMTRTGVPPSFWDWSGVQSRVAEIGTEGRPLWESNPRAEPEDCNAFVEVASGRLAFCDRGIRTLSDLDLEGVLIHEMTHVRVGESFAARAKLEPVALSNILMRCPDVAKEHFFATEGAAYWNQAAYLLAQGGSPRTRDDAMVMAAVAAVLRPHDPVANRSFAVWIVNYIRRPAELPNYPRGTSDCGMIVAVHGPNEGQFVLNMDVLPHLVPMAEFVPGF